MTTKKTILIQEPTGNLMLSVFGETGVISAINSEEKVTVSAINSFFLLAMNAMTELGLNPSEIEVNNLVGLSTQAMDWKGLAYYQSDLKNKLDFHSALATKIQKQYDLVRKGLLPAKMEDEGIESMRLADIGVVSLVSDVYVNVLSAKKEKAMEYLTDHGHEGCITITLNAARLKSIAKDGMKEGEPLPEEIFNVTPFTVTKITKK